MVDWEAAQHAIHALSRKWTPLIVAELAHAPQSYNTLARATGLDTKTLSRCLHQMEHAGIVARRPRPGHEQGVDYSLTAPAKPLLELLDELASWWHEWRARHQ